MFKKLFGPSTSSDSKKKEEKQLPWIGLNSIDQLNDIEAKSKTKTQVVFKHSTRCGISRMVMNQFVESFDVEAKLDLYYLDLLSYREVSNAVVNKFQVLHESPQLLVIKNGVVVAHASHGAINALDLNTFV
jgi:bacillithiol system protein YtxJ